MKEDAVEKQREVCKLCMQAIDDCMCDDYPDGIADDAVALSSNVVTPSNVIPISVSMATPMTEEDIEVELAAASLQLSRCLTCLWSLDERLEGEEESLFNVWCMYVDAPASEVNDAICLCSYQLYAGER